MSVSGRTYRNLFVLNLAGFIGYTVATVVTWRWEIALCAAIFFISTFISAKAYIEYRFARRISKR